MEKKTGWLQVRMDVAVLAAFHAVCDERGWTASQVVRSWVVDAVARHEKARVREEWAKAQAAGQRPVAGVLEAPAPVAEAIEVGATEAVKVKRAVAKKRGDRGQKKRKR